MTDELQKESQQARESLHKAVIEALDRKRRLGQYAVIWRGGRLVRIANDQTKSAS